MLTMLSNGRSKYLNNTCLCNIAKLVANAAMKISWTYFISKYTGLLTI